MFLRLILFAVLHIYGTDCFAPENEILKKVKVGDRVTFSCTMTSSDGSVVWLYTETETYEGVQHIYSEDRINSMWRGRFHVHDHASLNLTSTLTIDSIQRQDEGFYECDEERGAQVTVRRRVQLQVSGGSTKYEPHGATDATKSYDTSVYNNLYGQPIEDRAIPNQQRLYASMVVVGILVVSFCLTVLMGLILLFTKRRRVPKDSRGDSAAKPYLGTKYSTTFVKNLVQQTLICTMPKQEKIQFIFSFPLNRDYLLEGGKTGCCPKLSNSYVEAISVQDLPNPETARDYDASF